MKRENIVILVLSLCIGLSLVGVTRFFAGMSNDHVEVLAAVQANAQKLEDLEHMRAKATAKRFTSDHYLELSQCLRIPCGGVPLLLSPLPCY